MPWLRLGGWANPHRHPEEQAEFLSWPDAHADFFLTQVVSHHSAGRVEAFLRDVCTPDWHARVDAGCRFFVTQVVYDLNAAKNLVSDYHYE